MKTLMTLTRCFAALAMVTTVGAQAQLKPYENFNGNYLNPDRWEFNNPWNAIAATRELKNGAYYGSLRSYGGTDKSTGSAGAGNYIYLDQSKSDIAGWEATLNLDSARVTSCPVADSYQTNARMRMFSNWFNDANIAGGDQAGTVFGQIHARHRVGDTPGTVGISFGVFRCDDARCDNSTDLIAPGSDTFLGRTRFGANVLIGQSYDPATQEIHFWAKLPGQPKSRQSVSMAGQGLSIVDSDPIRRHALHFRNFVANCSREDVIGRYYRPLSIVNGRWQRVRVSTTPTRG